MPLAAVGLAPAGQPIALATLTVGIHECCGAGRVGDGPKVCSVAAVFCSLQAASGSGKNPIHVRSRRFLTGFFLAGIIVLRMFVPRLCRYNTEGWRTFTAFAGNFV